MIKMRQNLHRNIEPVYESHKTNPCKHNWTTEASLKHGNLEQFEHKLVMRQFWGSCPGSNAMGLVLGNPQP